LAPHVHNGPAPSITLLDDQQAEADSVATFVRQALTDGIAPDEIGLFVRSRVELPRARAAAQAAGCDVLELSERGDDPAGRISVATMHLAKGLEFKAVVIMACDDEVLPLQARID